MFFSVSQDKKNNFSDHYQVGNLWISTDTGWAQTTVLGKTVVYKGYTESSPIEQNFESIVVQERPKLLGNFCVFVWDGERLDIKTDLWRSFPIWHNHIQTTNLTPLEHIVYTDGIVSIYSNLEIAYETYDPIGTVDTTKITWDQAVSQVDQILTERISNFLNQNNRPLRVFLSGGVDTLLVYSYVKKLGADHELIEYHHIDYDYFWKNNSDKLKKFWGYNQIHHWKDPTVLASGAPGDEFMLRSPTTANLWLLHHGTNILEQLDLHPNCLHKNYFLRNYHIEIFTDQQATSNQIQNDQYLPQRLCNILLNDWQHWHLGNTITWTPLRDLRIFKTLIRLTPADGIKQIMNSDLSRQLIENNVPGLTALLSDQKNTGATLANLRF